MKKVSISLAIVIVLVLAISAVSASSYSLKCLQRGEQLNFAQLCNPAMDARSGPNVICVQYLDNGKICPASPNVCNSLGLDCDQLGGNGTTIDSQPPVLTLSNPVQNQIYSSKTVQLTLALDERSNVAFTDIITGNGKWTNACTGCYSYDKPRSFKEGQNTLLFRAMDGVGNTAYKNLSFYIDSKKPKISKTSPTKGFADGEFVVQFDEANPVNLTLTYGNSISGFKFKKLDINSDCILNKKSLCTTSVSLNEYDGENIQYWFNLSDIAKTSTGSKVAKLDVDLSSPIITSTNSTVIGKSWIITMGISEPHFDSVKYYDNSNPKATWKTLCSSLKNGVCTKKISLTPGTHSIDVQVNDEAGNSIATNINVNIP